MSSKGTSGASSTLPDHSEQNDAGESRQQSARLRHGCEPGFGIDEVVHHDEI
jgi:hypothetical protein